MHETDVIVVGAGIVGLSTAWRLAERDPGIRIAVLEKETDVARHQTGRNSGVLHSGMYYRPGSLKARTCRSGKQAMENFCDRYGVPRERCGKVIVATDAAEIPAMEEILRRGEANGVECRRIDAAELKRIEPEARGVAAIHVPETGIVDYAAVCRQLASLLRAAGQQVLTGQPVTRIEVSGGWVEANGPAGPVRGRFLVNCAGLHSDRLIRASGFEPEVRIVPFRGEYYRLRAGAPALCRNLIYPVPDPRFPFLGVHFTRMIDGSVECGPSAVLALAREGYSWREVNVRDLLESLTYPGFLRLAGRYWRAGSGEMIRSLSRRAFVRALQQLVPAVRPEHLEPSPAGVRAQALASDGSLVDDFVIQREGPLVHVANAPSPAATAAFAIAEQILVHIDQAMAEA